MRRPGNIAVLSSLVLVIGGLGAASSAARVVESGETSAAETVKPVAGVRGAKPAPAAGIETVQPEIVLARSIDGPTASARTISTRPLVSNSFSGISSIIESSLAASPKVRKTGVRLANADHDPEVGELRYFNGRPIRAVRTVRMRVTAYSPDHRSCGNHADGITASGYSVEANGGRLVAADRRRFPFGSLLTVPGYAGGQVVPVLDRGGAIKGSRLDVLYPTHEIARRWGVRHLDVTVWEYADGRPIGYRRPRGR